jgi:hypothetical protein
VILVRQALLRLTPRQQKATAGARSKLQQQVALVLLLLLLVV